MRTSDIRTAYLEFFKERGHQIVPSGPLVPTNDTSIMFTVAGMVQFKNAILGQEQRSYSRAASSQRCLRVGGKHNDLENVGFTARHNTFFEMLGNFSFGDYFKEETIAWAWEFVTETLQLEQDRLWVSVHPTDAEARDIWVKKIGVPANRVVDVEDNFWAMGDTGPCGPDSELFYDQGPQFEGGPPGSSDEDGDRFLEFWNLVFPQFNRTADGELNPLPRPGVDTGMGLERVAAITQGQSSVFGIDVFQPLIRRIGKQAEIPFENAQAEPSVRVIADHIRSSCFLISEGVLPDREGRGYVLRRVIRRAIRHAYKLGIRKPFLHTLVEPLLATMDDHPGLLDEQTKAVGSALENEEGRFLETLRTGLDLLDQEFEKADGACLNGDVAFRLYDTYGFPIDLTGDIAKERGYEVDFDTFETLMSEQRARARAADQFTVSTGLQLNDAAPVVFDGYERSSSAAQVVGLFAKDDESFKAQEELECGDEGVVVLDRTAFYGEGGGQVGDTGTLSNTQAQFEVLDTTRQDSQFLHHGRVVQGQITTGMRLQAGIHESRRQDIARNHSATHLLHAALREVLGDTVRQRGSLVAPDRLRFDFSHGGPVTRAEQRQIELRVNEHISANTRVATEVVAFDEAVAKGAVALFGERYDDEVRVLEMGNGYSKELCGGTHVHATGEIGLLRITSESGIAAGVRRIEAVTGREAMRWTRAAEDIVLEAQQQLATGRDGLNAKIESLLAESKDLKKLLKSRASSATQGQAATIAAGAKRIEDIPVIGAAVDAESGSLMSVFDDVRSALGASVVALGTVNKGRIELVCGVSRNLTDRLSANDLLQHLCPQVGARGGGKAELARGGGGDNAEALGTALASVPQWVAERIANAA